MPEIEKETDKNQGKSGKKRKGFLSFVKFKNPVTLVVCMENDSLKIAHGRSLQGQFVIQGLKVETISGKSERDTAQMILGYCHSQRIRPDLVLNVIPSKQFIFKNVDIPSTEKEEVSKIIDLQAGRFTPYMREEIVIDYLCLEMLAQHFTSVLLFIVNRKIAERYTAIFSAARIEIRKAVVASECMAKAYLEVVKNQSVNGALGGVHIGEDYSELSVMDNAQLVFVRNIPVGAAAFKKNPEQAKNDFETELNMSISAYHDQGIGKPIQKLLATGLTDDIKILGTDFKIAGLPNAGDLFLTFFEYQKKFSLTEGVVSAMNQTTAASFFELFSVLTYADSAQINLLLPEVRLNRRVRAASREALTLGCLIMVIFLLLSLIMGSKIYFKKQINQKLDNKGRLYAEEAKKLETVSTKNRIVKKLIESRGKELQVLNTLNGFIGDDLYLTQVDYDSEGRLTVMGTAASMSRVFAFVTQLKEANRFSSVETKETKSRKEGRNDVADFVIECGLIQNAVA